MFINSNSFGLSNGDAALAQLFAEAGLSNFASSGSAGGFGDSMQPESAAATPTAANPTTIPEPQATDGDAAGNTSSVHALVHELLGMVESMGSNTQEPGAGGGSALSGITGARAALGRFAQ